MFLEITRLTDANETSIIEFGRMLLTREEANQRMAVLGCSEARPHWSNPIFDNKFMYITWTKLC